MKSGTIRRSLVCSAVLLFVLLCLGAAPAPDSFRFAILGDRTGEAQAGVYERVWKQVTAASPAFVVSVGDTIQGLDDATAEAQWQEVDRLLQPFRGRPIYLAPGNHDVWSNESARLFQQYARHPLHFSFDYGQLHVTILDNSRSDQLTSQELAFLEADLKEHAAQPLKMIVSHRPSWLLDVATQNPNFPLHQLAKRYGVSYVVAGHIHQMMRFELEGIEYVSMASSGGHLRLSGAYQDGWFFGYALAEVKDNNAHFHVQEAASPDGEGRVTALTDWGMTGLVKKELRVAAPTKK